MAKGRETRLITVEPNFDLSVSDRVNRACTMETFENPRDASEFAPTGTVAFFSTGDNVDSDDSAGESPSITNAAVP
jgi:hypothetical protein